MGMIGNSHWNITLFGTKSIPTIRGVSKYLGIGGNP